MNAIVIRTEHPKVGTVAWIDLTVDDAEQVKDFYSLVVGCVKVKLPVLLYGYILANLSLAEAARRRSLEGSCLRGGLALVVWYHYLSGNLTLYG